MKSWLVAVIALVLLVPVSGVAQQEENYDYWKFNRQMIRYGQQAVFMCNGLFTGNRSLENVFAQELAFLPQPVGRRAAATTSSTKPARRSPSGLVGAPRS